MEYNYSFIPNLNKVRAWRSNNIPQFYMNVIIYPCPNTDAGLANIREESPVAPFTNMV